MELDAATHRYALGPAAAVLGLSYVERLEVHRAAGDALRELSAATDETATLSIRVGDERIYVTQVNARRGPQVVVQLGRPFPLHAGASSRAFLAFVGDDEQRRYLTQTLRPVTERTLVDASLLRAELRSARSAGRAASSGEIYPDTVAVAAPVFAGDGNIAGVISVCGPSERFHDHLEVAAAQLVELAERTSHRLAAR